MFSSIFIPISADNDLDTAKEDLREKGFPDEYLDLLDNEMIFELSYADKVVYDGKEEMISEMENGETDSGIQLLGTLSTSYLKQTLYFSRTYNGNKLQTINITAVGDWVTKPLLNNWDMIGISWSRSDWKLKDYSAKTQTIIKQSGSVSSSNSTLHSAAAGAFAIQAQLNGTYLTKVNTTFQLTPTVANSKDINDPFETIQLYYTYAHKTFLGNMSVSFGGFGVSVSISGNNDQSTMTSSYTY